MILYCSLLSFIFFSKCIPIIQHYMIFLNSINKFTLRHLFLLKAKAFNFFLFNYIFYIYFLFSLLLIRLPFYLSCFPALFRLIDLWYPSLHLPVFSPYTNLNFPPFTRPRRKKKTRNFTQPRRAYPRWDIKSILGDLDHFTWTTSGNQGKLPCRNFASDLLSSLTTYSTIEFLS